MPGSSSLYGAYRALGLVCDGGGVCVHRRGTASFITAAVDGGRALHLYDTQLALRGVAGLPDGARAAALAACADYTFVAAAGRVVVLRGLARVAEWRIPAAHVCLLLVVANLLIAVAPDSRKLVVWRIPAHKKATTPPDGDEIAALDLPDGFRATAVAHPPTYVNKILLGAEDGRLLLLNIRTRKVVHIFDGFGSSVAALTPSPVLDVVAVGTNDGRVVLYNIRVDETIATLRHGPAILGSEEDDDLAGAAVDLSNDVGSDDDEMVDHANGICEEGKKTTKSVSRAVSVLSFCTDGSETLVTGDAVGNLVVWDLNEQALLAVARSVHVGGTALAEFLPGEPLLVTAGAADNSIKIHIFDGPSRTARVLRSREGHRLPPTRVRFSGGNASTLVSAGLDRELRIVSAVRDAQNRSFSQARLSRSSARVKKRRRSSAGVERGAKQQLAEGAQRLPQVTGIATTSARHRDKDFASVVTIHARRKEGYTWRTQSGAVHRHVLRVPGPPRPLKLAFGRPASGDSMPGPERPDDTTGRERRLARIVASAVAVSQCGNFAFLGMSNGEIHSFNLQSGRHLGSFVADTKFREAVKNPADDMPSWGLAHDGQVSGLAVDACGDTLASCGGDDGFVRFWNARTREPEGLSAQSPAGITAVLWSRSSDLVAVAAEDFGVYVFDASTRKMARRLVGHTGAVTDFAFDTEGRRIVSCSMDGTIKTWDLPSGRPIDTLRCETAPTSVAIAPGGEYIATCHVNRLCISLWIDRSKYGAFRPQRGRNSQQELKEAGMRSESESSASAREDFVALPTAINSLAEPDCVIVGESADDGNGEKDGVNGGNLSTSVQSLGSQLITLSGRPTTQWTTLANLDSIKLRNKPLQPPKKPEQVPFFIPTVKAIKPAFDMSPSAGGKTEANVESGAGNAVADNEKKGEHFDVDDFLGNSEFGSLVAAGNLRAAEKLLEGKGPSGVDVELRTLSGTRSRLGAAEYFLVQLASRSSYEITQAHLDVFLKAHGRDLAADEGGSELLTKLLAAQKSSWDTLRSSFDSVLTLAAHFSGQV